MDNFTEKDEAIRLFRDSIPIFQALSDPARQDIIILLDEQGQLNVTEIANHSKLSRPAISHHLKVLRDIGLVSIDQRGTQRYYSLSLKDSVEKLKALITVVEKTCL
ncbi:winged helix-turn-helix transcriptional regulator [Bacillus sp. RG28]|uniref:Winged helix-turn-helix transcriptional regulator n=1 Tax=Gottfriedia endophytica TaxID=2820819 RepID=A0A940SII2_9BACI|nr:metalloregulator ArsR/SmtB family transcription factor [Gottfriedia endophytica]MBP0725000.1 winged helix-turn-helix transcriptional regulator [Gottfriedia endophytica]